MRRDSGKMRGKRKTSRDGEVFLLKWYEKALAA
jgi:hypothetical protein